MNYLKELKDEIKEVLAKDNLANIVISNTGFSAAFYEKVEKPVKAETKKTKAKAEPSALDITSVSIEISLYSSSSLPSSLLSLTARLIILSFVISGTISTILITHLSRIFFH